MYIIHFLNYVDMDNQSQSTSQVLHKLTSNDLATLVNELNPVAPECFAFGLQLGLHYEQLCTIERDVHKCGDQLREIIATRLNQGPPLTWCDVATALRADSVGKNELASELEDRYVNISAMALQTDAISAQSSLTYTQTRVPTSQFDNLDTSSSMPKKYHTSPVPSEYLTCSKNSAASIPQANLSPLAEGYSGSDSIVRETGPPAAKRCRVESATQSDTCSVAVDRQPTNAISNLARIIEEVINRHTTELNTLIGDDVYFTNAFIRLGIITRHSAKEIRSMHGIGNSEKGSRLLDTVTTNIGGSRDRFEKFVSVFSSEPAYQELATSMTENFRTRCNCSLSHNVAESCVACLPIGPFQSSVAAFVNHVKTVYRSKRVERDTKVVKWPPTPSEIYINLVLINRQSNSAKSKRYAEVTEAMVRDGNVDAIVNTMKGPIDFEEIAKNIRGSEPNEKRLILVEGAPGVGKSTFAWEFCRRWERGEIAQQYQLVLLLRLRDERISKAKSLQDLIYHPLEGVDKAVCTELVYSHNLNALLILEGFDELPDSGRNDQSVFMQLISGELLPLATVLVTSRPWATWVIRQNYGNRLSQHIEILGFTSDQITRYIESTRLSQDKVNDLNAYLERNPQIRSGMYIPLNSAIVVTVYQECQTTGCALPTTLTELYTSLTQVLLHRHMRGHPEYVTAIKYIDALALSVPPKVHDNFFKLCKLAYSGIVGTSDQIQLIFRNLPSDFDDLGFMDSVTELYVTQGAVSSYNFLHLTFQEFFAAMHISTMSEEEQLKHFYRHEEGRLKMVLRFLAGLKKLSCLSLTDNHSCQAPSTRHEDDSNSSWLLAGLSKRRIDNHFFQTPSIEHEGNSSYLMSCDVAVNIDLVHWMFEAQSEEITLGHGTVEFYSIYSLLPLDCYALGYCIVHSQCQWVLGIQWGEEEVRMLVAGASTKQETTAKVVGLHLKENKISTECLNTLFTKWKSLLHLHQLSLRLPEQCDSIMWPDLSTLQVLDIEFNSGTKWRLDTLLSHLSLDSLTVHIFHSDLVCVAIGDHIKSTSCHLKELFITSEDPGKDWFADMKDVEAITAGLASNHSLPLKRLELKCECEFTDTAAEDLAQFMTNTTTLCDLTIEHCTISVCGVLVLDRVIQQNSITMNLEDLTIEMEGEDEAEDLDQLLDEYPDMVGRIISTEIGDAGVIAVANALQDSHTLHRLDLSSNSISDDGAVALAEALHHNSTLTWLDLSDNSISDDGAVALAQALNHNSNRYIYLHLSDNSISDDGAGALAHALHRTHIIELLLPNNSISDDGAVALAEALHHDSTLIWLDLSNNRINDAGARALAQALHHNSTLKGLELSNNSISDAGAVAMAQALHHNSTISKLDLLGNDGIGGESTHQLVQVLTVNKSIRVILPRRCEEYATQSAQYQTVKNQFKFC